MGRRAALCLLLVAGGALPAAAQPVRPTDLVAVDEFIDAPRTVFGRTAAAVERTLGAPASRHPRTLPPAPGGRTAAPDPADELVYPGVVVAVSRRTAALRRVEVTAPGWRLPRGLGVGVARSRVEEVLGEAQRATDGSALYLYSDAYPDTVEFHFDGGRVRRIEWLYAPAD